jgi:hypothetical protein
VRQKFKAFVAAACDSMHASRCGYKPDGKSLAIHTQNSEGLTTIYAPPRPGKKSKNNTNPQRNTNVLGTAKQQTEQQISAKASGNYRGRTLGFFWGLGVFGSALAQSSKTFGAVLGYYGLGWTVYLTVISRGSEVEFKKNTSIDVRLRLIRRSRIKIRALSWSRLRRR